MIRVEHSEQARIFPFVEYSPSNKRAGLPLIIQLHGAGERGGGMAWNTKIMTMPVWTFHGDLDTTVSPIQSEEMVRAIHPPAEA